MCAFLSVTMDSSVYQINCFYCEEVFLLRHWSDYVEHLQSKHFEDFNDDGFPILMKKNSTSYKTDIKQEKAVISANEHDPLDLKLNDEFTDRPYHNDMLEIPVKENSNKKCLKRQADRTSYADKIKRIQCPDECDAEVLSLKTTEPHIVHGLLDILHSSYPLLWFIPPTKYFYHEQVREVRQILHEKFQLVLPSIASLQRFIQEIVKWFIQIKTDKSAGKLPKPQIEYFKRCEEFLSDKSDCTKTCEICEENFPDLVQYLLHKNQVHKEVVNSEYFLDVKKMRKYIDARYHHRIRKTPMLECKFCNIKWKIELRKGRKERYFNHLKGHANLPEFVCDFCGKAYRRWNVFVIHRRRHTGIMKRPCLICERSFNSYWDLTVHRVKRHRPVEGTIEEIEEKLEKRGKHGNAKYRRIIDPKTQKKRVVCNYCDKDFSGLEAIWKHVQRIHKAEFKANYRKRNVKKKKEFGKQLIAKQEEEPHVEILAEDQEEKDEVFLVYEENDEHEEEKKNFEFQAEYLEF